MKNVPKKIAFLYIIKMLKEGSSRTNPLNYTRIANALNSMGIDYDRKTVSRDIKMLSETNLIAIKRIRGGGCYYDKDADAFFKETKI